MSSITTINPATEEIIKQYPLMHKKEIEHIISKMHTTQKKWSHTPLSEKQKCLENMAKLLRQEKEIHAKLITVEMGKPITQSKSEIEKCAKVFEYYAACGERFLAHESIETEFYKSYRYFQPLGIIFAIMPWNFPYWQVMRFAAPNLILGNAGLLKHSPNTLGSALAIEDLFLKAGFPENLFRSLVIDIDLVPPIIKDSRIAGVTLTGSRKAGQIVAKEAGEAVKKLVLELGGNDPYVILEDADIEQAAEQCVISRLGINTGQSCIAAKRLIVVEKVKSSFEEIIIEKAKKFIIGDPMHSETKMGPLARKDLRDKVHDQIKRSLQSNVCCVLGGEPSPQTGYFYPATVLLNITENSPVFQEEVFGPVISIIPAKNEEEAITLANKTDFGLGGAIFTKDIEKGEQIARTRIMAGACVVNAFVASDPRLPFGGIKQSGYGRELSIEGIHEFANIKTVVISNKVS